jgi:hypothetical protein
LERPDQFVGTAAKPRSHKDQPNARNQVLHGFEPPANARR